MTVCRDSPVHYIEIVMSAVKYEIKERSTFVSVNPRVS